MHVLALQELLAFFLVIPDPQPKVIRPQCVVRNQNVRCAVQQIHHFDRGPTAFQYSVANDMNVAKLARQEDCLAAIDQCVVSNGNAAYASANIGGVVRSTQEEDANPSTRIAQFWMTTGSSAFARATSHISTPVM